MDQGKPYTRTKTGTINRNPIHVYTRLVAQNKKKVTKQL